MIVVSDATPLIGLASVGEFDLLERFFGKIYIAKAVYKEQLRNRGFSVSDRLVERVLREAGE